MYEVVLMDVSKIKIYEKENSINHVVNVVMFSNEVRG